MKSFYEFSKIVNEFAQQGSTPQGQPQVGQPQAGAPMPGGQQPGVAPPQGGMSNNAMDPFTQTVSQLKSLLSQAQQAAQGDQGKTQQIGIIAQAVTGLEKAIQTAAQQQQKSGQPGQQQPAQGQQPAQSQAQQPTAAR